MGDAPKVKRALTQRYDMEQLHALTNMEDMFLGELAKIFKMDDPDDLPVSVDLLKIFNEKSSERSAILKSELASVPGNCDELIAKVCAQMEELDAKK